jgi:peptide/nickel transport system permease protein
MTGAAAVPELDAYATPSRGLTAHGLRRFARQPTALTALGVLVAIFVAGALSHVLAPNGCNAINLAATAVHLSPSFAHPFGTRALGRDMLVRTLYGVRTTEEVALAAGLLATFVGAKAALGARRRQLSRACDLGAT